MIPIGINWKAVWKPVWKKVWKQIAPLPPIPPKPSDEGGAGIILEPRWKQIQRRNEDDLEVVRILTEFLSRM